MGSGSLLPRNLEPICGSVLFQASRAKFNIAANGVHRSSAGNRIFEGVAFELRPEPTLDLRFDPRRQTALLTSGRIGDSVGPPRFGLVLKTGPNPSWVRAPPGPERDARCETSSPPRGVHQDAER